jgi:alpha 1,2-mannosyltransferase
MEVFLANEDEYEDYICDVVLPSLNARCLVLSRILSVAPAKVEKYQYKPFAMLFSSFEEILFLDADAFPLEKPEDLFWAEPFRSSKMITWPDFWGSSVSPLFYEITDQIAPPMGLRQSTESGELLISKKTHIRTLLLCTYYNYWGPSHYYPLLSQGAAGEGDKETFVAAASVMQENFYQVSEAICALGHGTDGGMAGSAMAQFNPIQDFVLTSQGKWRIRGDKAPAPSVFFIHASLIRLLFSMTVQSTLLLPTMAPTLVLGQFLKMWSRALAPRLTLKGSSGKRSFGRRVNLKISSPHGEIMLIYALL